MIIELTRQVATSQFDPQKSFVSCVKSRGYELFTGSAVSFRNRKFETVPETGGERTKHQGEIKLW